MHFALTDVMEFDPDAVRDVLDGLGFQHLLGSASDVARMVSNTSQII